MATELTPAQILARAQRMARHRKHNVYSRRLSFDKRTLIEYAPGYAHTRGISAGVQSIVDHMIKYTLERHSAPPMHVPHFLTYVEMVGMSGWSQTMEDRFTREDYVHKYAGAWHISGNFVEVSAGFSLYTRDEELAKMFAALIENNPGLPSIIQWHEECEATSRKRDYKRVGEAILAERERNKNARNHS